MTILYAFIIQMNLNKHNQFTDEHILSFTQLLRKEQTGNTTNKGFVEMEEEKKVRIQTDV
ncbi:MAG: hypothetical protein L0H55_12610 [Candidatus Nitrosocosmicus sp.]|nr:hypothetical protein [Candidatus Nitrosocosmicus sp.]